MRRLLLTLSLLLLTSCIAPDGSTLNLTMPVDQSGMAKVRVVEVDGVEEFYRGVFVMCIFSTAAQNDGHGDVAGCHELTAVAYAHGEHLSGDMLSVWDWEIVRQGINTND